MPARDLWARASRSLHNRARVRGMQVRGALLRALHAGVLECGPDLLAGRGVTLEIYGTIRLGRGVILGDGCQLCAGPRGTLVIGDGVMVGRNTVIVAAESIAIGAHTLIAEHCTLRDMDHELRAEARRSETQAVTSPVELGPDVWLGAGVRVLRGTRLGAGVVAAANSVVRGQFGPAVLIGGAPARQLRDLAAAPG